MDMIRLSLLIVYRMTPEVAAVEKMDEFSLITLVAHVWQRV